MVAQVTFEFEKFVFVTSVDSIGRALDFIATEFAVLFALLARGILFTQSVAPLMW